MALKITHDGHCSKGGYRYIHLYEGNVYISIQFTPVQTVSCYVNIDITKDPKETYTFMRHDLINTKDAKGFIRKIYKDFGYLCQHNQNDDNVPKGYEVI